MCFVHFEYSCKSICILHPFNSIMTGARPTEGRYFAPGSGPVILGVICNGTEENITECSYGEQLCNHAQDAGVACEGQLHVVSLGFIVML